MTPVVIFQVKIQLDLAFVDQKLVSTLLKYNTAFYLVITQSFLNFPPIPQISSTERRIRLIPEYVWFNIFEVLKAQLFAKHVN